MNNSDLLQQTYESAVSRFTLALEHATGVLEAPYKVFDFQEYPTELNRVFMIPMIPFKWEESFEGLHTMLLDDNDDRSICVCKTAGTVRLPQFTHRRNERIAVIEGKIIDRILKKTYEANSIIDFAKDSIRDLEFVDAVFSITLTPPLGYNQK